MSVCSQKGFLLTLLKNTISLLMSTNNFTTYQMNKLERSAMLMEKTYTELEDNNNKTLNSTTNNTTNNTHQTTQQNNTDDITKRNQELMNKFPQPKNR